MILGLNEEEKESEEEKEPSLLVFENLKDKGFQAIDKTKDCLSVSDITTELIALADLHAFMHQIRDQL